MNRLWRIILTLTLLVTICSGCGDKIEEINTEQNEDIISFLEKSHDPKLIAESAVAESLSDEPPFYVMSGSTTFRYIEDYYNVDRATKKEIAKGSNISITFTLFDFSSFKAPSTEIEEAGEMILYSNNPTYKSVLEKAGLNTTYWNFTPKQLTIGGGTIFGSVESLLVGCREGDTVEFYLTVEQAYGDKWLGVAELESPVMIHIYINSVEN